MKNDCLFCDGPDGIEEDLVKRYKNWTVFVNLNQQYLGRCIVKLNRHIVDFFEIIEAERKELFETVIPELKGALERSFEPDLFNYASLGNCVRHLHLHVIPRYKDERKFRGVVFRDRNWNSNYKPYNKNFEISEELRHSIAAELRNSI